MAPKVTGVNGAIVVPIRDAAGAVRAVLVAPEDAETPVDISRGLEALIDKATMLGGRVEGISPAAILVAFGAEGISKLAEGMGQELFNASILGIAVGVAGLVALGAPVYYYWRPGQFGQSGHG